MLQLISLVVEILPVEDYMEARLRNHILYGVLPQSLRLGRIRLRVNLESASSVLKKKQLMGVA